MHLTAHVLLVDDIEDHLKAYEAAFLASSFHVDVARTGRDALATARRRPPDCAVIDVRLPDMTGWELCAALKTQPSTKTTPIVVLSPEVSRDRALESVKARCHAWLMRPSHAEDVVRSVQQVLALEAGAPSSTADALVAIPPQCVACGSEQIRATLRIATIQYYCCRDCGLCWRTEPAMLSVGGA